MPYEPILYIKDKIRVRDSSGKEFDVEMDLKIEIQSKEWQLLEDSNGGNPTRFKDLKNNLKRKIIRK